MSRGAGAKKSASPRQQSTKDFIKSALGSTEREPGWEYGQVLPVRARKNEEGEMEREWGLGYSNTAKGMLDAITLPRRAFEGEEVSPEQAMEMAMNITAPGVATARYAPGVLNMPIVYHGTPHKFPPTPDNPLGEFDASKIGSGQGAQAQGHGIYLAEARDTAQTYKDSLSRIRSKLVTGEGVELDRQNLPRPEKMAASSLIISNGDYEKAAAHLSNYEKTVGTSEYTEALNRLKNNNIKLLLTTEGSLYTADLPDNVVNRMMDWDKPLIDQPEIHDSLEKLSDAGAIELFQDMSGKDLLEQMDKAAGFESKRVAGLLKQAGILGIKYLDQGSRAKGEGTRNFVVFPGEEKKAKILKRD